MNLVVGNYGSLNSEIYPVHQDRDILVTKEPDGPEVIIRAKIEKAVKIPFKLIAFGAFVIASIAFSVTLIHFLFPILLPIVGIVATAAILGGIGLGSPLIALGIFRAISYFRANSDSAPCRIDIRSKISNDMVYQEQLGSVLNRAIEYPPAQALFQRAAKGAKAYSLKKKIVIEICPEKDAPFGAKCQPSRGSIQLPVDEKYSYDAALLSVFFELINLGRYYDDHKKMDCLESPFIKATTNDNYETQAVAYAETMEKWEFQTYKDLLLFLKDLNKEIWQEKKIKIAEKDNEQLWRPLLSSNYPENCEFTHPQLYKIYKDAMSNSDPVGMGQWTEREWKKFEELVMPRLEANGHTKSYRKSFYKMLIKELENTGEKWRPNPQFLKDYYGLILEPLVAN